LQIQGLVGRFQMRYRYQSPRIRGLLVLALQLYRAYKDALAALLILIKAVGNGFN
jgi:hypothetical protein